jgi:hypothetical protein
VDEGRQLILLKSELQDVVDDDWRETLLLFFEVVQVNFQEGYLQVTEESADGLQLAPKTIVDQNGRKVFEHGVSNSTRKLK